MCISQFVGTSAALGTPPHWAASVRNCVDLLLHRGTGNLDPDRSWRFGTREFDSWSNPIIWRST